MTSRARLICVLWRLICVSTYHPQRTSLLAGLAEPRAPGVKLAAGPMRCQGRQSSIRHPGQYAVTVPPTAAATSVTNRVPARFTRQRPN